MAILDGWFASLSAKLGTVYVACGSAVVTIARVASVDAGTGAVTLDAITELGEGGAPQWYNPGGAPTDQLLYYNRTNSFMVVNTPPPFVAVPFLGISEFNAYGAGGGIWAGFRANPSERRITTSDGGSFVGRMGVPAGPTVDQNGRTIFVSDDTKTVYVRAAGGVPQAINATGADTTHCHIATGGAVWARFEAGLQRTYGWRGAGAELVHVSAASEYAVPIDTPNGPWILSWSNLQLLLRPWGGNPITAVNTDGVEPFFPHGVYSATLGGFVVAWNSPTGVSGMRFLPVDISGIIIPPPGSGGGSPGVPPVVIPGTTPASAITVVPPKRFTQGRRAIYPHVTEIADAPAKQSVKLLWDRMHDLTARLETGDIATRLAAAETTNRSLQAQVTDTARKLAVGDGAASTEMLPPAETGIPGGDPGGGGDGGPGPGPGGGGTSGTCADSPGTGHYDPGGALTEDRARKISCGTGDEWSALRVPTSTVEERDSNAETLLLRIIWHLAQAGYTVGRQRNPSTAISKDKFAIVIGTETRAFDVFIDASGFTVPLRMQWFETFPADLVADGGIAD